MNAHLAPSGSDQDNRGATRRVRFLHVLDSCGMGGIENTFLAALKAFGECAQGRCEHEVLALAGGLLEPQFREVADRLFVGDDWKRIEAVLSRDYDVVHVMFERAADRVLPLVIARGQSLTFYTKGYDLSSTWRLDGSYRWRADELLVGACDGVAGTTRELLEAFPRGRRRAAAPGKAFAASRFAAIPDVSASTPDRILCVGSLHAGKRVRDLVPILADVCRRVPTAELRIVGRDHDGEAERISSLARQLGMDGRVSLSGATLDVPSEIAACRVLALPSLREGVPTVLLEAMAAGRPVVATRVGHVHTIVTDGVEGMLAEAGDLPAFADAISRILGDRVLAARFGDAGRRRARAHDVLFVARRWLGALLACARRHARAGPPLVVTIEKPGEQGVAPSCRRASNRDECLDWFTEIGADRYSNQNDLPVQAREDAFAQKAWRLYGADWRCFTGARVDPDFNRFALASCRRGRLLLPVGLPALVVGTGPSLAARVDELRRKRKSVFVLTSLRGAQALRRYNLVPDLVLVGDEAPLQGVLTLQLLRAESDFDVLSRVPFVALTPWAHPQLVDANAALRAFIPDPLPTWGLWPVTAAALALVGGVQSIGLLGIDLGTADAPAAEFDRLRHLLELLALMPGASFFDLGEAGARKAGWIRTPWFESPAARNGSATVVPLPAPGRNELERLAREALARLGPILRQSREALQVAESIRDGSTPSRTSSALRETIREAVNLASDPSSRRAIQDELGLTYLPRFWRIGLEHCPDGRQWQPALLALGELVQQADRLSAVVGLRDRDRPRFTSATGRVA